MIKSATILLALIAVITTAPAANPARASGAAMLEAGSGRSAQPFTVVWQDADTVRVNMPYRDVSFLLVDGAPYALRRMNRQFVVLSLDSLGDEAAGLLPGFVSMHRRAASVESLRPLGREETVAGIVGETFEMIWTDTAGRRRTDRLVLSDDPRVLELSAAITAFEGALGHTPDARGVAVRGRGLGLLRGMGVRVTSLSDRDPRPGTFPLPGPPMTLEEIKEHLRQGQPAQ
jgi:hypothetical protein